MNAAHRRAARGPADDTFDAAGARPPATLAADRRGAGARTWRRPVVAILAGTLAVAMLAGTVSASKPGGPLYATRLWIEMANLPAEVVARAQAEINRLDARLQEAQQASAAGDGPAASGRPGGLLGHRGRSRAGKRRRPDRQRSHRGDRHPPRRRPRP